MRIRWMGLVIVAAFLGSAVAPAAAQDLLRIAATQRGTWDSAVPELGQRAGIFRKHGLTLEILYTQGGAEAQQAVIAGSCDIAVAIGVDGAIGAFARGAPLRIIGNEMVGSPDTYWYVPANSPIRSVQDLDGKTISYSVQGSSSHAAVLALLQQYNVNAKPVATGNHATTLTMTMTGQIDVGGGGGATGRGLVGNGTRTAQMDGGRGPAPIGLDLVEQGKTRIIVRGSDIKARGDKTVRVLAANLHVLDKRKDAVARFVQAYRETLDWMYSDPAALRMYEDFSGNPERLMRTGRDQFFPKGSMWPDEIKRIEQVLADAQTMKFISAPLTAEQIKDMIQIPAPPK
jgi:ABC-type nitrate/sulfonate/bicarbonate transport system substrate-binding protein